MWLSVLLFICFLISFSPFSFVSSVQFPRSIQPVPYSGTVGNYIPKKYKPKKKGSVSPLTSPLSSPLSSPRSNSVSSLFDTELQVGGVLTFSGRVHAVTQQLYPGNMVMSDLIQLMNTKWWNKCTCGVLLRVVFVVFMVD